MNNDQPKLTHAELAQFTGELDRYCHPLNRRVLYTPGVRHLAERGGAYWLIDAIASYIGSPELERVAKKDRRLTSFQLWRLVVVENRSALLACRADSGVKPAISQEIHFTDFPLESIDIWAGFDGEQWTLYLPSEH